MHIPYLFSQNPPLITCDKYREQVFKDPNSCLTDDDASSPEFCDSMLRHQYTCLTCVRWALHELNRNDLPRAILSCRDKTRAKLLAIAEHLDQPPDGTGRV